MEEICFGYVSPLQGDTNHVLNICNVGKETGRWTWRHNCIVSYVVNSIDTEKYTVFSDIPGHTAAGGGSVPPEICITAQKPDIVIVEKSLKSIHLFELTCPLEQNIKKNHDIKLNKYAHFVTDLSSESMKCRRLGARAIQVTQNRGFIVPNHTVAYAVSHQLLSLVMLRKSVLANYLEDFPWAFVYLLCFNTVLILC